MESGEPARKKIRMSCLFPRYGLNWLCTYNKRCPLVRYLKTANDAEEDMVKYFYKDLEKNELTFEEFTLNDLGWLYTTGSHTTVDELINDINELTEKAGILKFTLIDIKEKPFWAKVFTLVDDMDWKIPKKNQREGLAGLTWVTDENYGLQREQFKDQTKLVEFLMNALVMDFTNGHAKKFISTLIERMLECLPVKNHDVNIPRIDYGATTRIEKCYSKGQFNAAFPPEPQTAPPLLVERSPSASPKLSPRSMSPSCSVESGHVGQRKVPDVEVYQYEWPGRFPLVVEAIKSTDSVEKADEQILQKMFTKFCFQDIIFGLRISAVQFSIQVLIKDSDESNSNRNIILSKSRDIPLFKRDGVFLTENLNLLFSFVYSLLDWCSKTECILHKPKA